MATKPDLSPVDCSRGAPMGRATVKAASKPVSPKWTLQRVRLDSGGYDSGGAYWGIGQPLYWACNDESSEDHYFRAADREDAKAHVRSEYDAAARFYR